MATTNWATIYGTVSSAPGNVPGRRPWVNWRVTSQNTNNNTSSVSIEVGSDSASSYGTSGLFSGTLTANGTNTSMSAQVPSGTSATIGTTTRTVTHNSDGKKSITIKLTGSIPGTGGWTGTNLSATVTLPTIPRATTATFSGSVIAGNSLTINTPRASTSFTHDLQYQAPGTSTWNSIASGVATSYTWTTPVTLSNSITTGSSGTFKIRTTTKSGSTTIGTTTKNLTVNVPSNLVPTLTSVSVTDNTSVLNNIGAYVQGYSQLKITPTGAAGINGSTITGYEATINGTTYSATGTGVFIIPADVVGSGMVISVQSVDSRGRKSTSRNTSSITVLSYVPPAITSLNVFRSDGVGGENQISTTVGLTYSGNASKLMVGSTNKNTATMRVHYRQTGTTPWTTNTIQTVPADIWSAQHLTVQGTFAIDKSWEIKFEIEDKLEDVDKTELVTLSQTAFSIGPNGAAVGAIFETGADKPNLQVVGGMGTDYQQFDFFANGGRSVSDYFEFAQGKQIETIERATENGLDTPIKTGNHFGILYTTSPLEDDHDHSGLTQRFYCNKCNNSWVRVSDGLNWDYWSPISLDNPNILVQKGVAYQKSGVIGSLPSSPAFTNYGSGTIYARSMSVPVPFTAPSGWYFHFHVATTSGYTLVGNSSKNTTGTASIRHIQIGSGIISAMSQIGWTLCRQ